MKSLFKTIALLQITSSFLPSTALAAPSSSLSPISNPSLNPQHEAIETRQQQCTSPKLRKEWSKATRAEQQSYIDAALCLATKPSRLGLNTTLYDDFGWIHGILFGEIHGVPAFLPWHRYFIQVYEEALHDCGYTGTAMYWDWVADSAAPSKAAVWDPVTGFGGNGTDAPGRLTQCVRDGPFRNLRPAYWNNDYQPHCLVRLWAPPQPQENLQEMFGFNYNPNQMEWVNAEATYAGFNGALENTPHAAVHFGIGQQDGDVGANNASPNDPIFFLHHTQVDRLWWLWQQADPEKRTLEYGAYEGSPPVSLDDLLPMGGFAPDRKVREFMDIKSPNLCYTY